MRFARVDLGFRISYLTGAGANTSVFDVGLNTSGDFQEGQKTVLGKVSGVEDGDAILAVIGLKVLD